MAKVKYTVKENKTLGTHSFYAVPISNGTLTTDEIIEEACENTSYEKSLARGIVSEVMKVIKRNVLKGFRVNLGEDFLTIYPNLRASVKDETIDGKLVTASARMVTARNAVSRLGCSVNSKFSRQFADEVSWQKVDARTGDIVDDDIVEPGNSNGGSYSGDGI